MFWPNSEVEPSRASLPKNRYKVTNNKKTSTDDGVEDDDQDEPLIVRTVTNFLPHCKLLEVLHILELQQFCEKPKRKNQRDTDV